MNARTNARNRTIRTVAAAAALIVSVSMLGSIDLLSRHYGNQAQVAAAAAKSLEIAASNR